MSRINILNQKYGRLTVVEECGRNKHQQVLWRCQCDCGNETFVTTGDLRSGHTKSCGCYNLDKIIERAKKYNTYDLTGEYGIGYTSKDEEFYFDLEDYDIIKDYCWRLVRGYVSTHDENGNTLKLHRLIFGLKDKKVFVDHINHKLIDCRKANLRLTDNQHNTFNKKLLNNSSTGVTGVYWNENKGYWEAKIGYNYKSIFLGAFNTKEDAIRARKQAEEKYFGEYSYDNSMKLLKENVKEI